MKPYKSFTGKAEELLETFEPDFFDSIVTDPPYGIRFMGKAWDDFNIREMGKEAGYYKFGNNAISAGKYNRSAQANRAFQEWTENWCRRAYRVLKPGGYLICFASPRTYHRMASGVEDAGFEIRDQIFWVFSSGFPKSHNLKDEFEGWGSALKPAHEPIIIARKPLSGSILQNMKQYGTGAINIDGCRIDGEPWKFGTQTDIRGGKFNENRPSDGDVFAKNVTGGENGRWPANLIHDGSDEVVNLFPQSDGQQGSLSGDEPSRRPGGTDNSNTYGKYGPRPALEKRNDSGSAARFFYCAKTSSLDRDEGLSGERKPLLWSSGTQNPGSFQSDGTDKSAINNHPTVKPTNLMRYLCRLVTPPGGHILDPFAGSGSTGKAAMFEHFRITMLDEDPQWKPVQDGRCEWALQRSAKQMGLYEEN